MFACHHSLALPREFQSYHTLLLCSEHVQEIVLRVTLVVVISLAYQQTKNNPGTLNFQFHVTRVFSALHFVRNKFARTELFIAQSFNLLNALHADNGSILPTLFTLFTLSLMQHYCTGVLISPLPDQEGNKLQRQKILSFIYPVYNHNWRNISTIYIYIYI